MIIHGPVAGGAVSSDPTSKKSGIVDVYDILSDVSLSGASPTGGGVLPGGAAVMAGLPDPVGEVVVMGSSELLQTVVMMGPSDLLGTVTATGALSSVIVVATTGSPGSVCMRLAGGVLDWGDFTSGALTRGTFSSVGLAVFTGARFLTQVGCGLALRGFRTGPIEPGTCAGKAWGVVGRSGGAIAIPGIGLSV